MAITLAPPTFLAPGTLTVPGEDGKPLEIKFAGRFRRLPKTERQDVDKRLSKRAFEQTPEERRTPFMQEQLAGPLKDVEPFGNDADFLDLLLKGWELKDLAGQPVEFTPENRAEVFEGLDGLEAAFVAAYFTAIRGEDIAKNL